MFLAVFLVFLKAASGDWSHSMNCWKGVLGVTFVEWALVMIVNTWVYFLTQINLLSIVGSFAFNALLVLSFGLNYYIFVTRGVGIRFEQEVAALGRSRSRQAAVAGNVVIIVIFGSLFSSFYFVY